MIVQATKYVVRTHLHSDLLALGSEHMNDEDSMVLDFCSSVSSEINSFSIFFGCVDNPSQDMFIAPRPIDFSSSHMYFPLLEMHTNEVSVVLFEWRSKANRRLLILLSSSWTKNYCYRHDQHTHAHPLYIIRDCYFRRKKYLIDNEYWAQNVGRR